MFSALFKPAKLHQKERKREGEIERESESTRQTSPVWHVRFPVFLLLLWMSEGSRTQWHTQYAASPL